MKKKMIILSVACAVLAGIFFAVIALLPEKEDDREYIADVGRTENGDIFISDKSAKMVESIEVTPADGKSYQIIYSKDEYGNQIGTIKGAGEEFKYKSGDLYTIAGYVSYILAIEEIENPQGRDAEFGFDKPSQKIRVNFKGNQKLDIILGSAAPSGDGIYLKRVDTGRVYLIGGSTADMLMMSMLDYRDLSLYEKYSTVYEINELSIQRPGEEKITIRRKTDVPATTNGTTEDMAVSRYEVVSPDVADADNTMVEERFYGPFINIVSDSLIEDHPKDLSIYGLHKPVIIEVKDKYGAGHTLKVGDKSPYGGHYIMCDDVPSVLTTAEPVSFLDVKHTDFMMRLVWQHNFADVSEIDYILPSGETHNLKFIYDGEAVMVSYDGGDISRDNAINLFMHTIQFEIQGGITADMTYGAPEYKIFVRKTDGSGATLEFSRINERYFAASVNGATPKYYVNVSQINALAEAFAILASGGNVPSIF